MKKLFFLDYKGIGDLDLSDAGNSVLQILKRYSLGIGDYEQNELTEAIFNRLGWSNKYKDTIFSFRTTICKIFEVYSKDYPFILDEGERIIFYFRNNTLEYEINGSRKDAYWYYSKDLLYKKVTDEKYVLNKVMKSIGYEIFYKLETVAGLVDSLSNFTPHPGYPFNQAKGKLENVADSLNLMIDKVQDCIDKKECLVYGNKPYETIAPDKLLEWKNWFISNQTSYCLNGLYEITEDEKIVGKKLFTGQSLAKPLPTDKNEIKEYLCNIIKILYERGEKMNGSIR